MIFKILAEKDGTSQTFYYDNLKNVLRSEDGLVFEYSDYVSDSSRLKPSLPFDKKTTRY